MSTTEIPPLTLGDLFDRTFRILGRSLPRSVPVALIALLPPGLLLMLGLDAFYSTLGELLQTTVPGGQPDGEVLEAVFWTFGILGLAGLALLAGTVVARVGITSITCAEMFGERITLREALGRAAGVRFTRALGQVILEYLTLGLVIGGGYFLLIGSFITGSGLFIIGGVLVFLAAGALFLYLAIRWSQTYAVIAWENTGALASFRRSGSLVETGWWRVMGILLLFGFLKEFVASLITTPVALFSMWDFYQTYFSMLGSTDVTATGPGRMLDLFSSVGLGLGLTIILGMVLSAVITPAYAAALYVDLRARHGEFVTPTSGKPDPPEILPLDEIRFDDPGVDFKPL